jgi:hypothetical protein
MEFSSMKLNLLPLAWPTLEVEAKTDRPILSNQEEEERSQKIESRGMTWSKVKCGEFF